MIEDRSGNNISIIIAKNRGLPLPYLITDIKKENKYGTSVYLELCKYNYLLKDDKYMFNVRFD